MASQRLLVIYHKTMINLLLLYLLLGLTITELSFAQLTNQPFILGTGKGGSGGGPPTPPTQASVANFTICVVCMDFTQSSGGVWINGAAVSGVNASDTSTWLDCAGASNPIFYAYSPFQFPEHTAPCQTITTDDQSTQVFQELLPSISLSAGNSYTAGVTIGGDSSHEGRTGLMPLNAYMEVVARVSTFPVTANNTFPQSDYAPIWWGGLNDAAHDTTGPWDYLEFDSNEVFSNPGVSTAYNSCNQVYYYQGIFGNHSSFGCNWSGSYPPNDWSTHDLVNSYIKIGQRITSDGSNQIYKCMWIQDVAQGCINQTVDSSLLFAWQLSDAAGHNSLNHGISINPDPNVTTTTPVMQEWVKTLSVWSCSSWKTTACSTPGNPDPGGY
jgi:hypothetical protein